MHLILLHGYLLQGTGSNIYVASVAQAWRALGCAVTVICQERRAASLPFVDEVVLPGAHNAMASADVPGWMFPNHVHGIPDQLQAGIRALLIDVYGGTPVEGRIKTDLSSEAARKKFDSAIGRSIYGLLPGVVENTFAVHLKAGAD